MIGLVRVVFLVATLEVDLVLIFDVAVVLRKDEPLLSYTFDLLFLLKLAPFTLAFLP